MNLSNTKKWLVDWFWGRKRKNRFNDWYFGLPLVAHLAVTVAYCVAGMALLMSLMGIPLNGDWAATTAGGTVGFTLYSLWQRRRYERHDA